MSETSLSQPGATHNVDLVWSDACERLQSTLNPQTFTFAFGNARAIALDDDALKIGVDTEFARNWIQQRYMTLLRDALFEVTGVDLEVELVIDTTQRPAPEVAADTHPHPVVTPIEMTRRSQGLLQPRFTFDAFVTGPSNHFAHAAALAVAEAPARAYNPFFIYGGVGLGKTHLLHAIGHFIDSNYPELAYMYVSVETFTNEFIKENGL